MNELQQRFIAGAHAVADRLRIPWSQLADRAGVSRAQFFEVVDGESSPTLDWISRMARGLGVSPWELLGADPSPAAEPQETFGAPPARRRPRRRK